MISKEEVAYIAKLSRLEFNEAEFESLRKDLNNIVSYADQLQNVKVEGLEVKKAVSADTDLREDLPSQFFSLQEALQNAPEQDMGAFVVPPIIE